MTEINVQTLDTRELRFSNKGELNELHRQLSKQREREIQNAIAAGLVDDPTVRRALDNAIAIVGTCQDFCSQFEKVERHLRNEVKRPEMVPGTDEPDYTRMVKAFARPNDSNNVKLPSEIRPAPVLQRTVDYLFHKVLSQASSWISVQEFIFDRTRAIRQDFTIQGDRSPIAVECHERIARFLILSLHESKYGQGQEDQEWEAELRAAHSFTLDIEQLNKTLTTLMQYYDDFRSEDVSFPNEPEFRAYRLLLQLRDADVARRTQSIPPQLLASPYIQSALNLRNLAQNPSSVKTTHPGPRATAYAFARVLKEMRSDRVTFLMACLMETHFNGLRKECLRAMAASYISKTVPMEKVTRMLGFESDERAEEFVKDCGLTVEESSAGIGIGAPKISSAVINRNERNNFSDAAPRESKTQSALLVAKRGSHTWADLLDGKAPPPNLSKLVDSTGFLTTQDIPKPGTWPSAKAPSTQPTSLPLTKQFPGFNQSTSGTTFSAVPSQIPKYAFGVAPNVGGGAFGASSFGSAGLSGSTTFKPSNFGGSAFQALPQKPTMAPFQQPSSLLGPSTDAQLKPSKSTSVNLFALPATIAVSHSSSPLAPAQPQQRPVLSPFAKLFIPNFTATLPDQPSTVPQTQSPFKEPDPSPAPVAPPPSSISLSREPSIPAIRKPSLPPSSPSPTLPSPRTISRLEVERDAAVIAGTVETMVRAIAQLEMAQVVADEWSQRRRIRSVVRFWKRKAMQTRERRRAEEESLRRMEAERASRWERLMGALGDSQAAKGEFPSSTKSKGKRRASELRRREPMTGEGMMEIVQSVLSERDIMWEKGVFLEAIDARVKQEAAKAGEKVPDDWTLWLTRCEREPATWQWLRAKFGVDEQPEKDIYVLPAGADMVPDGPSYPGLLVFELPPRLSTLDLKSSEPVWSTAIQSLGKVLAALPTARPYHLSVILLYWGASSATFESQRSAVLSRIQSYLRLSHATLVLDMRVVIFEGSSNDFQAFKDAINSIALDASGILIDRTPLEDVVSAFAVAWERMLMDGLAICESIHLDRPAATWPALGRLFALLVDSLNELQGRISELADVISEEALPEFSGAGPTDEESFYDYLITYLAAESLLDNAVLTGLRSELIHLQRRKRALPIQPIAEQLAWQLTCRLTSLANEVSGNTWKVSMNDFEERNQEGLDDLRRSFPPSLALEPEPCYPVPPTNIKKRPRNVSGDREQLRVAEKRSRSSAADDLAPQVAHNDVVSHDLANELLDLEKLLAQSEAMLAA
ncbi:hypothetical protein FRB95_001362 [Tulasnella sp. JGI-2019a]|nr:hypothetical protein FRB95_001362 [Tulasnella sp. JGI-2019a]